MVRTLYILLVCYMPIIGKYLPSTNFGSGIPDLGPVRMTSYLLIFIFVFESVVVKQTKVFSKWIFFISLYLIFVLASVSWSKYSYTFGVINDIFNTVMIPLIIAIIAINLFSKSKNNIDAYIKNIIITSFILSLMSLSQMFLGGLGLFPTLGAEGRSTATFANPNILAIFLVLTIPCLIYAIEEKMIPRIFGRVLVASTVGGIICTVSRKGMITCILAFSIYYFLKGKFKQNIAIVFVVLVLLVILSGIPVVSERFSQDRLDKQVTGKWAMAYAGIQMFKKSPLIGLGYKGYYENFGKYFPWSPKHKYDAHNMYITNLANFGIVGFILFLGILLYPIFVSKKIIRQGRIAHNIENDVYNLAIICISSVIPYMVNGFWGGGVFHNFSILILLYTNIALVFAIDQDSSFCKEG